MSRPGAWKKSWTVINNSLDQFHSILHSFWLYDKMPALQLARNATGIDEKWATPTFLRVRQVVRDNLRTGALRDVVLLQAEKE